MSIQFRSLRARRAAMLVLQKPEKPASPELHTTLGEVNPQLESLFFTEKAVDGKRIPAEIRTAIFEYAFTDDLDLDKPYEENTHYTRPEHTCKRKTSISLLLTCKRIYQETYHLPLKMKVHTFFRKGHERIPPRTIQDPVTYFSNLPPSQLEFLRSFHFFVQQYWLEDDFFKLCQRDVMKHVVNLKITIRRSDWWEWEHDIAPAINPYKPFPRGQRRSNDAIVMKQMWEAEKQNPSFKREFDPKYWGSAFQHLPKLKTLTMEFETEKSVEADVDAIAEYAKAWKFPMGTNRVLSADGCKIEKTEWEGPICMRPRPHETVVLTQEDAILAAPRADGRLDHVELSSSVTVKPVLIVRTVRWEVVST